VYTRLFAPVAITLYVVAPFSQAALLTGCLVNEMIGPSGTRFLKIANVFGEILVRITSGLRSPSRSATARARGELATG